MRELGDGRAIASDRRDNLVQLADVTKQTLTRIGREGSGPAEYKTARSLYALSNNTEGMRRPAHKRPFVAKALSIDGAGRAWVLRTAPHNAPGLMSDVFVASARRILSVTIRPKTKVVGFGAKWVYLAFTDDDDLQHLQRFAAPQ